MKKISLFFVLVLMLVGCGEAPQEETHFAERDYSDLPKWNTEVASGAHSALLKSCSKLIREGGLMHKDETFGSVVQWGQVCKRLRAAESGDVKGILEQELKVIEVLAGSEKALFTGYFTPELEGRFKEGDGYETPLYGVPFDLVSADLGLFDEELKGKKIVARVENGKLLPYAKRAGMQAHLGKRDVVLWLKDPVAAFFLHVQGSGIVALPGGQHVRVGYAGDNGHRYKAIGKTLVELGHLTVEQADMNGIVDWLKTHPKEAQAVFNSNPRFIFFRLLDGSDIYGAQGVALTDSVSLAVDRNVLPLGVPVYVSTTEDATGFAFEKLMVAQDVGSAIKGRVRGDIYFGIGDEAGQKAGVQRSAGRMFVLVPR